MATSLSPKLLVQGKEATSRSISEFLDVLAERQPYIVVTMPLDDPGMAIEFMSGGGIGSIAEILMVLEAAVEMIQGHMVKAGLDPEEEVLKAAKGEDADV